MSWINKYAELLTHYSLYLKEGELLYLRTTCLAEELVRAIAKSCTDCGAILECDIEFGAKEEILISRGNEQQLNYFPNYKLDLIKNCDAYLVIRAPYDQLEQYSIDPLKENKRNKVLSTFQEIYFDRLGKSQLKRSLCQFPTEFAAKQAGMTLDEYTQFIIKACHLDFANPAEEWISLCKRQQIIVDYLNKSSHIVYQHQDWKIEFNVKGRTWINSDGKSNMPSGEVFTSPIEDSVEGEIYFNYPTRMFGEDVEGIFLKVSKGFITNYSAQVGQSVLDKVFATEGARYFGEAAIGTNMDIQRATKNILFDEKIGGTIHMAVGQSYYQCGGKNKSAIHWDLITDMKNGGSIYADDVLIYENGVFLI